MACHTSACHAFDFWIVLAILVIITISMIGYCCWFKANENTKDESTQRGIEPSTSGTQISIIPVRRLECAPNCTVSDFDSNDPRTLPPPSYNEVIESSSEAPPSYYEAYH